MKTNTHNFQWIPVALGVIALLLLLSPAHGRAAQPVEHFTVASYNLENYLDVQTGSRPPKSEASKAAVRQAILTLRADVLALQEIGTTNALLELRESLRRDGLDYPHWTHASGFDTNIHVAVLSRFPFIAQRHHTNEPFLLYGRRFHVRRAFAEVDIRVHDKYQFTLINAHLKSRLNTGVADQAELREQEALRLRRILDTRLQANPNLNLVLLGDLNDHYDSVPIRTLRSRGTRLGLIDTRPAEPNGDDHAPANPRLLPRRVTWTSYYSREDSYSRVDYILLSHAMAREWDPNGTYVLAFPNWGLASDHRPIVARFHARDR